MHCSSWESVEGERACGLCARVNEEEKRGSSKGAIPVSDIVVWGWLVGTRDLVKSKETTPRKKADRSIGIVMGGSQSYSNYKKVEVRFQILIRQNLNLTHTHRYETTNQLKSYMTELLITSFMYHLALLFLN